MDEDDNDSTVSSNYSTDCTEDGQLSEKELEKLLLLFSKDIHRNFGVFISLNSKKKKKNNVQSVSNENCHIEEQNNNNISLVVNNTSNNIVNRLNDIPKHSNQFFGRDREADNVYNLLTDNKLAIVTGIEGIGKTEFAKHFAEKFYENFDGIEWINGATKEKVQQSIAYITNKHNINNNVKDFVEYFKTKKVLFIIDNAYSNIQYRQYFPASSKMHLLMTTTNPDLRNKKCLFPMTSLTDDETIDLLSSVFLDHFCTDEEYDWKMFSNYFEKIPLALQLSGSCLQEEMIKNKELTVEQYYNELLKKNYKLEDNTLRDEYRKIYFAFKLTMEKIESFENQSDTVLDILNTCVYLDDDYISTQLLMGHEKIESKQNLDEILGLLEKYNLVTIEIKQNSNEVHIHSLIRKMLLLEQKQKKSYGRYFTMALTMLCIMGAFNIKYLLNFVMERIEIFLQFFFDNELFDLLDPIVENGHDRVLDQILNALPDPKTMIDDKNLLLKAIESEQTKTVKVLLLNDASVDKITTKLRGPLHKASKRLLVPIIGLILLYGADANQEDYKKNTPLHTVVGIGYQNIQDEEKVLQCIRTLMKYGANLNEPNIAGDTPLTLALDNKAFKVALFLINQLPANVKIYGYKTIQKVLKWEINSDKEENNAQKVIRALLLRGADRNETDVSGQNLLIWAVQNKCEQITQFLLENCSFNANFQDSFGQTALHKILDQKICDKKQAQIAISIIKTLLSHEARTDIKDNEGLTAYDICLKNGNVKLCLYVRFLMGEFPDYKKKKTFYLKDKSDSKPQKKSSNNSYRDSNPYRYQSNSSKSVGLGSGGVSGLITSQAASLGYLDNTNRAAISYSQNNYCLPGPSYNNLQLT